MNRTEPTNQRYQTILEALEIIDPAGTLAPGTPEHNRVTDIILAWMAEMEPEEVVRLSKSSRRLVRFKLR
jgi:hypothetical protein